MTLGPKQTKWLEALRSGKYKQGCGWLHMGGTYCCLGVANEVLELGETVNGTLANTYRQLGLCSTGGAARKDGYESLVNMNDNGDSFNEIADVIEAHPEVYFTHSV